MWPNPQETAIWSLLLKASLMENFIFCAVLRRNVSSHFVSDIDKNSV